MQLTRAASNRSLRVWTAAPASAGVFFRERGQYDDPTELASRDRPLQVAAAIFALITVLVMLGVHAK